MEFTLIVDESHTPKRKITFCAPVEGHYLVGRGDEVRSHFLKAGETISVTMPENFNEVVVQKIDANDDRC